MPRSTPGGILDAMPEKPTTRSLQAPGVSGEASYDLPADGSSPAEPAPAIREPGRPPSKNRAPAGSGVAIRLPGGGERLAPDDRLARPEAGEFGEEVIDGVRMECHPAESAHADPQCRLAHLVSACLVKGYVASVELLTRTGIESDFATDVCVRRVGVDPETRGRYLEEISFEVANTQTRKNLEEVRVPKLVGCGVRRIFAVMVPEGDVLEWSIQDGEWVGWAPGAEIRDPLFVQPLEVTAILDAAQADQLVSKAQLAKREPYLMRVLDEREAKGETRGEARGEARGEVRGEVRGEAKGLAKAILRTFERHGVTLDVENREAILECQDMALLEDLFDKALEASSAAEVLAELEKIN